jgi:hypothetical protein
MLLAALKYSSPAVHIVTPSVGSGVPEEEEWDDSEADGEGNGCALEPE